jgi:hypothetical protein
VLAFGLYALVILFATNGIFALGDPDSTKATVFLVLAGVSGVAAVAAWLRARRRERRKPRRKRGRDSYPDRPSDYASGGGAP